MFTQLLGAAFLVLSGCGPDLSSLERSFSSGIVSCGGNIRYSVAANVPLRGVSGTGLIDVDEALNAAAHDPPPPRMYERAILIDEVSGIGVYLVGGTMDRPCVLYFAHIPNEFSGAMRERYFRY